MNIAFVLDDGLDSPDGVQQYIVTLGDWLRNQGHEVYYLVGQTKCTDIKNIYSIPKNIGVRFNGNRLSIPLPASKRKIRKILDELNLDVIHVQVPYSPLFGAKVVRLASPTTAIIGTFHIFPYGFLARVGTQMLGFWLRRNLKLFDTQLSVSSAAHDFAKQTFKIHTKIVPNMIDSSRFRPLRGASFPGKTLRIVFLGRLVKRKGCHLLLAALGSVHKTNPDLKFHLDIAGRGEMMDELKSQVSEYGLQKNVTFHGFVSEKQKIALLQTADLAVFPSFAGESFGIVLIEAMAAGSQVVLGGKNPGYISVLSDVPESLISVQERQLFADELTKVMKDKKLRQAIHAKQQLLIDRYDVCTVGEEIMASYTECLEEKRTKNRSINE